FIHATNVTDAETEKRRLVCYDCGVACDMTRMREQRVGFLRELGALEPERPRLPLISELPVSDKAPARKRPEFYRPPRPGGAPARWRLRFAKLGPAALLGHLDLIRELPRAIRRAGVRLAYSEGFHPKPEMSFGPA